MANYNLIISLVEIMLFYTTFRRIDWPAQIDHTQMLSSIWQIASVYLIYYV